MCKKLSFAKTKFSYVQIGLQGPNVRVYLGARRGGEGGADPRENIVLYVKTRSFNTLKLDSSMKGISSVRKNARFQRSARQDPKQGSKGGP